MSLHRVGQSLQGAQIAHSLWGRLRAKEEDYDRLMVCPLCGNNCIPYTDGTGVVVDVGAVLDGGVPDPPPAAPPPTEAPEFAFSISATRLKTLRPTLRGTGG